MRPRRLITALAVLCGLWVGTLPADEPFRFQEARHGRGELKYVDGLPVMFLEGTPEEIGRQHVALIGEAVKPLFGVPQKLLDRHGLGAGWPLVVGMSRRLIHNAPERYRRELEAAVAPLDSKAQADAIYVGNALLELRRLGGCSSVIVLPERSRTGGTLFGRNLDFPTMGFLDRYSLITVYRPTGRRAFVAVGFPGMFGVVSGMNDAGLALATNDVYRSNDGSPIFNPEGVPLALTYRRILEECATVAEAEKLLREAGRTTYMNLAVCDSQGGAVFELTPQNVVARRPDEHLLTCTNHFCSKDLSTGQTCRRLQTLQRAFEMQELGVKEIGGLLHAVNQGDSTIQTMIFEPSTLRLHLSLGEGPTSARPLTTLDVKPLLQERTDRKD